MMENDLRNLNDEELDALVSSVQCAQYVRSKIIYENKDGNLVDITREYFVKTIPILKWLEDTAKKRKEHHV